jgi:hypothetical protein
VGTSPTTCAHQHRRGIGVLRSGQTTLAPRASTPQPALEHDLRAYGTHCRSVAAKPPRAAPLPRAAIRRSPPEAGAQCGSPARWDLCEAIRDGGPHRDPFSNTGWVVMGREGSYTTRACGCPIVAGRGLPRASGGTVSDQPGALEQPRGPVRLGSCPVTGCRPESPDAADTTRR